MTSTLPFLIVFAFGLAAILFVMFAPLPLP